MLYRFEDLTTGAKNEAISEELESWSIDFESGCSEVDPAKVTRQEVIDWFDINGHMFDIYGHFVKYENE